MSRWQELVKETPPATMGIIILCSLLHALQSANFPNLSAVTLSPRLVLGAGEIYRLVTNSLYHANLMHIGMNMLSMAAVGAMVEKQVGSLSLIFTVALSMILTSVIHVAVAWLAYSYLNWQSMMYQHSVGFSGVLFHLAVLECAMGPLQARSIFGMVSIPPVLYPWALLVVLQLILPHLSFWGHLSGIIVGTLQVHGYLNMILPIEGTFRELDSFLVGGSCPASSRFSFVPTQNRVEMPVSDAGRVARDAVKAVRACLYDFAEALYVIVFGRRTQ